MMAPPFPTLSKYRLLARLGSGGMAEVYLVHSEGPGGFNKLQVLKLMRSDLTELERPDFLRMFEDEARLAARLNHPNIVQSHEVGDEDGQPFIVMEFLEGQPLSRVQQRARHLGGGFPLEMELFVLCHVLEGLDYAHRLTDYDGTPLHIVHRDVSPQNVFITYSGQTKLVDFGVAKTLESSKTRAGVVKGKVAYMPPEQVTSGPIDHRADLFSVGVLLWEAVAGQSMHADLSVYESLNRLVRGDLPKIRDVAPEVPRELERIVTRALQLDPTQRYPDADSFRHDLLTYLETTSKVRARDVGEAVARLFSRERAEISQVIRRAMTEPPARESASEKRVTRMIPTVGSTPGSDPHLALLEAPTTLAPVSRTLPPKRARSLRVWGLSALSVLVVLGVSTFLALSSRSSGARSLTRPPTSQATVVEDAPTAMPSVQVQIGVEPPEAAILLDGRVLGQNPYRAREPRDGREHTVAARAPGFRTRTETVRFDADVQLSLRLEPAVPEPNPAAEPVTSAGEPRAPRPMRGSGRAGREPRESASEDPYVDLPPPKQTRHKAPELDKSDPWKP